MNILPVASASAAPKPPVVRATPESQGRIDKPWPKDKSAATPLEWAGIEAGTSMFFERDPRATPGSSGGHPIFLPQDAKLFTRATSYSDALRGAIGASRATGENKEAFAVLQARDGAFYFAPLGQQSPDATGEPTIYNENGRFSIEKGAALSDAWAGLVKGVDALRAVVGAQQAIRYEENSPTRPNLEYREQTQTA